MKELLKSTRGEAYFGMLIYLLISFLVIALFIKVAPTFIVKYNLDVFAHELVREAELRGCVGTDLNPKIEKMKRSMNITPDEINWGGTENIYGTNRVQLGNTIELSVVKKVDIGFYKFGSFPINLRGSATGRSGVYWK